MAKKKNSKKKNAPKVNQIVEQKIQEPVAEVTDVAEAVEVTKAPEIAEAVEVTKAPEAVEPVEAIKALEAVEAVVENVPADNAAAAARNTVVLDPFEVVEGAIDKAAEVTKDTIPLDTAKVIEEAADKAQAKVDAAAASSEVPVHDAVPAPATAPVVEAPAPAAEVSAPAAEAPAPVMEDKKAADNAAAYFAPVTDPAAPEVAPEVTPAAAAPVEAAPEVASSEDVPVEFVAPDGTAFNAAADPAPTVEFTPDAAPAPAMEFTPDPVPAPVAAPSPEATPAPASDTVDLDEKLVAEYTAARAEGPAASTKVTPIIPVMGYGDSGRPSSPGPAPYAPEPSAAPEAPAKSKSEGFFDKPVSRKFLAAALGLTLLLNGALAAGIMGLYAHDLEKDIKDVDKSVSELEDKVENSGGGPDMGMAPPDWNSDNNNRNGYNDNYGQDDNDWDDWDDDDWNGSAPGNQQNGQNDQYGQNGQNGQQSSSGPSIGIVISDNNGVYISEVTGNNAKSAGFQTGDKIVEFDGEDIDDSNELISEVKEHKSGDKVTVIVERNGKQQKITTTLE